MKSDADLVQGSQSGDLDAFGTLVRRYERLARAAALHICRDKHAAEDIAQEAFLAAFESLRELHNAESFGSWLLTITRRKAVRYLRSPSHRIETKTDIDQKDESDVGGKLSEAAVDLLALVEKLPDHERIVVGLKHFDGHSIQEIATITGRPTGTITKQLSRSYEKLRQWVTQEIGQ